MDCVLIVTLAMGYTSTMQNLFPHLLEVYPHHVSIHVSLFHPLSIAMSILFVRMLKSNNLS